MRKFWKKYHKWVGLVFSFFILVFCFSGIILNHREAFSNCGVGRGWLPKDYHYENWNNGIIEGTFPIHDKVLCYGNAGVWKTDSCFSYFESYNEGIRKGIDHRKISNIVQMPDSSIWCAGLYDLYRLDQTSDQWEVWPVGENKERITDLTSKGDSLVVMTRSHIFVATGTPDATDSASVQTDRYTQFVQHELKAVEGYEAKVSLFRTFWLLHSGEMFGLPGKLFVDLMALVLIFLCITGIIYFFWPDRIKRRRKNNKNTQGDLKTFKFTSKWHNKIGIWLFVPTLFLAVTGMCLRPPLMIPLVMSEVKPIPGSALDSDNPWNDKFRGMRWDEHNKMWILSTSEGFHSVTDFDAVPVKMAGAPGVSPMGINVFDQTPEGEWLIGSFSGLFRWNIAEGKVVDYFTDEPIQRSFGPPVASIAVSGFSNDLTFADELVFDYGTGVMTKDNPSIQTVPMPEEMVRQPLSLWNFALELHVGRCYYPLLGPFSSLFVFLSGLLLSLLLISGFIIRHKTKKKKPIKKEA